MRAVNQANRFEKESLPEPDSNPVLTVSETNGTWRVLASRAVMAVKSGTRSLCIHIGGGGGIKASRWQEISGAKKDKRRERRFTHGELSGFACAFLRKQRRLTAVSWQSSVRAVWNLACMSASLPAVTWVRSMSRVHLSTRLPKVAPAAWEPVVRARMIATRAKAWRVTGFIWAVAAQLG